MAQNVTYMGIVGLLVVLAPALSLGFTTDAMEKAGLTFDGYVEVEVSYIDGEEDSTSDVALAELALGVEYAPVAWLSANVVFLYEDGADGVEVDEAYASIGGSEAMPVVFTAGRLYLPTGAYTSTFCSGVFCSDPLTQSLGEAQEDVLQASYDFGVAQVAAGVANGDVNEVGDDAINLFYAVVEAKPAEAFTVGVAYTSNLADSDTLTELMPEDGVAQDVGGLTGYVIYESGAFYGSVEYLTAAEAFSPADLDADEDGSGDQPWALNVELGYMVQPSLQLGARYATTGELADLPEDQYGVVANYEVFDGAVLSLEYLHNELAGGGDEDCVIGHFSLEF